MSTLIESYLYGSYGTHGLYSLTLTPDRITIAIAPWSEPEKFKVAVFESVELQSIWTSTGDTPMDAMPWDIIGFDSTDLGGGRWEFLIYCNEAIEICWRSQFPSVTSPP